MKKFQQKLEQGNAAIALIGMSNIGKTFLSKALEANGFARISCDDRIEAMLAEFLQPLGYEGIEAVSQWMGQPYDEQYSQTQQNYLNCERRSLEEIYGRDHDGDGNLVIDTTGSFVHLDEDFCEQMGEYALRVYVKASEELKKEMFEKYLQEPKPVVFGDQFSRLEGESDLEALGRSYRGLLDFREKLYEENADVVIERSEIPHNCSGEQFLNLILK